MKPTDREKVCPDCGEKFVAHFNKKRCAACTPKAKKKLREKFLEKWLPATKQRRAEYNRQRMKTPEVREAANKRSRERHAANPEKYREKSRKAFAQMTQEQKGRINERQRIRNKRQDVIIKNKERCRERYYKDHEQTLEHTRQRFKTVRDNATPEQKEKERQRQNDWSKTLKGKAKSNRTNSKRKALKLKAILESTDFKKVSAIYKRCVQQSEQKRTQYNVDHIIPLSRGGAHHQDNLQIISASENFKKGCTLDPSLGGVWADNDLAKQTKQQLNIA